MTARQPCDSEATCSRSPCGSYGEIPDTREAAGYEARRWSDGESSPWTHLLCGRSGDDGCVGRIRGAGWRTKNSGNCAPDRALTDIYARQTPSLMGEQREI